MTKYTELIIIIINANKMDLKLNRRNSKEINKIFKTVREQPKTKNQTGKWTVMEYKTSRRITNCKRRGTKHRVQ